MGSSIDLNKIGILLQPADRDFQRQSVADLCQRPNVNFVGAQPVSFGRKHLQELQARDYFMCEKTDGVRCLLYLTQTVAADGHMEEAQFLIDRKNDYYYIPGETLHIPKEGDLASFHTGTLLDGELVRQQVKTGGERLAYLIFDCLAIDGENIMQKPFDKRLHRIDSLVVRPLKAFVKQYPEDAKAQPFQIEMKNMQLPYGTEMMFKDVIPQLPHGNDGLIFTCKGTPYHVGTDEHILKWKPPHENTIDFLLLLGEFPIDEDDNGPYENWDAIPSLELHVNHGNGRPGDSSGAKGYQFYAPLALTPQEWTAFKSLNQQLDGRIIECFRDPNTSQWRPKLETDGTPRFRDDKKDANFIETVDKVIESIKDAVTERDLIAAAGKIKWAYKERAAKEKEGEAQRVEEEKRKFVAEQERRKVEMARRASAVEVDDGPRYED